MPLIGLGDVQDGINNLEESMNEKLRAIYLQGLDAVIEISPAHFKDGGRLRNSWSLNTSGTGVGTKRGPDEDGTGSRNNLYSKMPDWVLGKKLYFINPMPYANVVEYGGYPKAPKKGTKTGSEYQILSRGGYSIQAPEGMVRVNLDFMKLAIRNI